MLRQVTDAASPELIVRRLIDEGFSQGRLEVCDFQLRIEDLVVADDTVWIRNVATGTNDGSYMGHPPTGKPIRIEVYDVLRVSDGQIVEHWGVPDRLGALLQTGLVQRPGKPAQQPAPVAQV
jgi:hypothetical protein